MVNPRTEKAIKAWLALPEEERTGELIDGAIVLYQSSTNSRPIARFTIRSIVAKRYPRRKKKVAK